MKNEFQLQKNEVIISLLIGEVKDGENIMEVN